MNRLIGLCFIVGCFSGWGCSSPSTDENNPGEQPGQNDNTTDTSGDGDDTSGGDGAGSNDGSNGGNGSDSNSGSNGNGGSASVEPSSRFAEESSRWAVPGSGLDDGFFWIGWSQDTRWFSLMDLNGDGRSDLVHTADASRSGGYVWTDAQGPYWKVYWGEEDGFSDVFSRWSVPQSGEEDGFFGTFWGDDTRWFSTRDLNGDGKPDLIQTADTELSGGFAFTDETGSYWKVYFNEGDGFTNSFTRWQIPSSGQEDGFFTLSYGNGNRWFTTLDLNGDALPDLVHTADPDRDNGFVWSDGDGAYWNVYWNGGSGFDLEPTRWAVPDSGLSDGFFTTGYFNGTRWFTILDLNSDGLIDLLHTADINREGGHVWSNDAGAYWKVYLNQGTQFATEPVEWSVPTSGLDDGFFAPYWTQGSRSFSTQDIDGDGQLELIQTADPTLDGGYVFTDSQGAFWRVFPQSGSGFSSTPNRWSVPSSGLGDGFFAMSWASGDRWFATLDVTGDGRMDLIQTATSEESGGQVWADNSGAYWKVWAGQ